MQAALSSKSLLVLTAIVLTAVFSAGCGDGSTSFAAVEEDRAADTAADDATPKRGDAGASTASGEEQPGETTDQKESKKKQPDEEEPEPAHPFRLKIPAPEFPKDMTWLNTGGPIRLNDLRGKFVLLDFWTYCCINCIHTLPELKKLEKAYPKNLVVIGVHSPKFDTEKKTENIKEAILRYDIEHPVVNDAEFKIWSQFGANSWPTLILIDPEGNAVWGRSGEVPFETLDKIVKNALPYYRKKDLLDEEPIRFELLSYRTKKTPLRFPGKVLADEKSDRLVITDSNHHRIVITTLDGELLDIIGTGAEGADDGPYGMASFKKPQGVALLGQTLYVADTENHLIRKVDLKKKQVTTIAGTGKQARMSWPGIGQFGPLPDRFVGKPLKTGIASPWALLIHEEDLYIAMAGPHQIWKMPLDESEIGPYAGNGREDIVDGPLLPKRPYDLGFSSFAQPSGLASDGKWLYVADSEGSSVRAVPFDPKKEVKTVVGTAHLRAGRLFEFGDVDGVGNEVRLQHVLGVVHHDGLLYIADTYNNKIKVIDPEKRSCKTLVGPELSGTGEGVPAELDEPAGVSYAAGKVYVADTNNHLIRVIDLKNENAVSTLQIDGLKPPSPPEKPRKPSFPNAVTHDLKPVKLKPTGTKVTLQVELKLPEGWKINDLAPSGYYVEAAGDSGPVDRAAIGRLVELKKPAATFQIELPVESSGSERLTVSCRYFYCRKGSEGICKVGNVVWNVPIEVAEDGTAQAALQHEVTP